MALPTKFTPDCPGCGKKMALVEGKAVHYLEKHLHKRMFYICTCSTYEIMCYPDSLKPMGRPGDATLRDERRWVDTKLMQMIKAKVQRDGVSNEEAAKAAFAWVSKIVGKPVTIVEELNIKEMGSLIPELRKF